MLDAKRETKGIVFDCLHARPEDMPYEDYCKRRRAQRRILRLLRKGVRVGVRRRPVRKRDKQIRKAERNAAKRRNRKFGEAVIKNSGSI